MANSYSRRRGVVVGAEFLWVCLFIFWLNGGGLRGFVHFWFIKFYWSLWLLLRCTWVLRLSSSMARWASKLLEM